jgi:hypothetical protein
MKSDEFMSAIRSRKEAHKMLDSIITSEQSMTESEHIKENV